VQDSEILMAPQSEGINPSVASELKKSFEGKEKLLQGFGQSALAQNIQKNLNMAKDRPSINRGTGSDRISFQTKLRCTLQ
jgi:hypothetical protein